MLVGREWARDCETGDREWQTPEGKHVYMRDGYTGNSTTLSFLAPFLKISLCVNQPTGVCGVWRHVQRAGSY